MHYNSSDYYIAVLGYPRSGKSIFITSLINHLLYEKGSDYETIKINDETKKKLKDNIKCLNSRIPFKRTNTESIFPYRVDISKGKFLLKKNYKLQIGDFTGDNSAQFHNGYRQWFHKSPSFIWTLQADAFIFVVDLAEVLAQYEDDFYCEKVSNAIYKAWKRIEKSHLGGKNNLKEQTNSFTIYQSGFVTDILPITSSGTSGSNENKDVSIRFFKEIATTNY